MYRIFCQRKIGSVKIVRDEDQDYNDLDKSIKLIKSLTTNNDLNQPSLPSSVIIVGAYGGRFDQEMANIHCLYKWKQEFDRIILINEENVSFLLQPGYQNIIKLVHNIEGPNCGLIPLANKVNNIKTSGNYYFYNKDLLFNYYFKILSLYDYI